MSYFVAQVNGKIRRDLVSNLIKTTNGDELGNRSRNKRAASSLRARGQLKMTCGGVGASVRPADVVAAGRRRRRVGGRTTQLGATGRFGRTTQPIHLHHFVAVGPV